ncbi:hypothetical protein [Fretibacter rubidus]|uniref:hypothetical protein n=1 Tax=Fretibacter rubidus TaxID=570162 RepID=UPI00352A61A4
MKYKARDWGLLFIAVCVFIAANILYRPSDRKVMETNLRQHFLLPDDIQFSNVKLIGKASSVQIKSISAKVNFSDTQWENYLAQVQNPTLWHSANLHFERQIITGKYEPNARVWYNTPEPITAKDNLNKNVNDFTWLFNLASKHRASEVKNGKVLCYVFQKQFSKTHLTQGLKSESSYKISACSDILRREQIYTYVYGVLDFEQKNLHMFIL